jgi:hypothetical protein
MSRVQIKAESLRASAPLSACGDDALAAMVTRGNGPAFSELARRHSRLIAWAMRREVAGLSSDDLRQEALVGLMEACHAEREPETFTQVAESHVRRRVRRAYGDAVRAVFAALDRAVVIGWPPAGATREGSVQPWN